MLHPAVLPLSMTALLALAPTCLFAQSTPIEPGQYFGVFDCGSSPRAELISIIKQNDSTAARVRTFPVNGGPYFQWHDALYQVEAAGDGPMASVKSAYVRQTVGDEAAPAELLLQPAADGGIVRLESGTLCGGNLSRLDATAASPSDFAEILQGTIAHLSTGRSGTERVNENTDPRLFPIEILSTVDEFGSFITMRLDGEGRTCLFSAQPAAGTALERRLIHGVGDCSDGTVTFTERGPMLVLDWGGGYRELAGALVSQDQLIARFLAGLGQTAPQNGGEVQVDTDNLTMALDGIEGEYGAQIQVGLGQYVDYSIAVTKTGIHVVADGMWNCFYVVDPQTGDSYVYKATARDCEAGKFSVLDTRGGLTFKFEGWDKPVSVPFISGSMGAGWQQNVPDVAKIKGVALGDPTPQSAEDLEGYTLLTDHGELGRYHRSSIGMLGVTSTNYFDGANYRHASAPEPLPGSTSSISFDDMGIYSVEGKVVAVLRYFEPMKTQAPRYEAVQEALFTTYGVPTVNTKSGAGSVYEWHFDANGNLIVAGSGRSCEQRLDGDETNSRGLIMLREKLESSLVEAAQGLPPRIERATVGARLRVSSNCEYSIRYHIHPRDGGLLDHMTASMFAYDPVRTEIWKDREPALSAEIARNLEIQANSQKIAPDL